MASRARNKLNVKQVANLSKPGIYGDGGGLYLRIRESGRSWFFVGTHDGKRFEMGLGSALDVGLAKARERASEVRDQLIDGRHPVQERKRERVARQNEVPFGKFALDHVTSIESGYKNPKHRQQWRNSLQTYAKPIWDTPLSAVNTEDVLAVLQPIWLDKPETASRVRGRIERVLDAAKIKRLRHGENPARAKGHLDLLLPKRKRHVKHHAALPYAEIGKFMAELCTREGMAAKALELTVLTAARSGETRGMTWGEVDLPRKLWTVPKVRMKADREHTVPLSDAALAVLLAVREEGLKSTDLVFTAPRGGSLSDMALSAVLKRMGYANVTVHGFRSTFRDWAGEETTTEREVIEFALAHNIPDAAEAAYRRYRAVAKRRELMDLWATYCAAASGGKRGGTGTPPPK